MSRSQCTFEQLLQPIDAEAFLTQYWEQRSLLVSRNSPDYYAGLISVNNIDAILQFSKPKYPKVKLGKSQKRGYSLEVLDGMGTHSIQDYGVPNLQRLYAAYAAGDTLVLDRVDRYWEPLARMCRDVARYFSCPAGATIFLTPKNSQGFLPHFDHDDMFILQIEGAKVWRIYNSSPHPSLADEYQPLLNQPLPAPEHEIYLRAGDLLYIPRGCVHEVLTTDAPSLHVALDVHAFTWADLVTSAIEAMSNHTVPVHKALPVGFLNQHQPTPSLQEQLTDLLESLCQHANAEAAVARLARRFIDRMQPLPDGHFSQLAHLHQVTLDSTITKRHGMFCRIATHDHQASIQFPGNAVQGPDWIVPALRFIAATDTFTVRSLPDVLSDNGKLVLVRRLIREGLLKVVPADQGEVPLLKERCPGPKMGSLTPFALPRT